MTTRDAEPVAPAPPDMSAVADPGVALKKSYEGSIRGSMKVGPAQPLNPAEQFERAEQAKEASAKAAKTPLMGAAPLVSPPGPDDVGRYVNTKA